MARYIDADAFAEYEENAWDWDSVNGIETKTALRQVISDIKHEPTADVVERRENPIDAEEVYWHFKDVDGHKNLVIRLKGMFTDITDIRIRLDKYNLKELVKGEWKRTPTGQPYCSVCGDFPWEHESSTRSYCSECGAKMKEVEE